MNCEIGNYLIRQSNGQVHADRDEHAEIHRQNFNLPPADSRTPRRLTGDVLLSRSGFRICHAPSVAFDWANMHFVRLTIYPNGVYGQIPFYRVRRRRVWRPAPPQSRIDTSPNIQMGRSQFAGGNAG